MADPTVSVVLPVYRSEPHLGEALDSLAMQSFADFETIVVSDDLDSSTADALSRSPIEIHHYEHDGEGGLAGALNKGLDRARGTYLARMDADDIARSDRIARQVAFLDDHPDVGVLGTSYEQIDAEGRSLATIRPPRTHLGIRWQLLLQNCIPHPTAMIRRSVLEETGKRYRPSFNAVEDYDLWIQLADVTQLRNLSAPLLRYRIDGDRKSRRDAARQQDLLEDVVVRSVSKTLVEFNPDRDELIEMLHALYTCSTAETAKRPIADRYISMLRSFEETLAGGARVAEARRHASLTLARYLLRPPVEYRSLPLLIHAFSIDPRYPLTFARFLWTHRVSPRL